MSLNDQTMAGEVEKWEKHFKIIETMKGIDVEVYDEYDDALERFKELNRLMDEDFCYPIGIAARTVHDGPNFNQFRIISKELDGWEILICNALLVFGDQPCIVRVVDESEGKNA